jgi:hemerythrin-like metal-binding protein
MINKLCSMLEEDGSLRTTMGKGIEDNVTEEILDEMTDYASSHFFLEEKYFQEFKYEKTEEHMAQHELFRLKTNALKEELKKGKESVALETLAFLSSWFVEHILHYDREYVECFHKHGL